jgi:hypothetical protein
MSTKRGPLSKAEKFYIEKNAELGAERLASDLNRKPEQVLRAMNTEEPKPEPQPEQPAQARESRLMKLMGRHERKGEKVATVMTRAASELADETRPSRISNKMKGAVHKPRG